MSQSETIPADTNLPERRGLAARLRDALPIVVLALGVPVTLAWIGGLTFVGFEAVSWLVEVVAG